MELGDIGWINSRSTQINNTIIVLLLHFGIWESVEHLVWVVYKMEGNIVRTRLSCICSCICGYFLYTTSEKTILGSEHILYSCNEELNTKFAYCILVDKYTVFHWTVN